MKLNLTKQFIHLIFYKKMCEDNVASDWPREGADLKAEAAFGPGLKAGFTGVKGHVLNCLAVVGPWE